jgi:DNA-binding response OmpR family regulator
MAQPAKRTLIRTLVVVDNDDDDEFIIRRALKKGGLTPKILRLSGGKEAIEYFGRTGRFGDDNEYPAAELVFLDINMPDISGFEVLSWMKDHKIKNRPFVAMLSSSDLPADVKRASELGADCYLTKPPTVLELRRFAASHDLEWSAV